MQTFWDEYYKKPLEEIPWQHTQADWFKQIVDSNLIKGNSALDLGCGTGMKSIYLAKNSDFKKVVGVDISKQAIFYAKLNSQKEQTENICTFIDHDINDWSFIKNDDTFDFIIDWAAIHCLPKKDIQKYAENISNHCNSNGYFLVRFFSSDNNLKTFFKETISGVSFQINLFSEKEIKDLFPNFNIVMKNKSLPSKAKTEQGYYFIELLMQKV